MCKVYFYFALFIFKSAGNYLKQCIMENSNQLTFHQVLKKQTKELHEKAHQIPYISNLLKDNVSKESLVGHLRAFTIIYGALEHNIEQINNSLIEDFLNGYTQKLPRLLLDLENINAKETKDIIPAVSNALSVADRIMIYSLKSPWKLIGFIYTLDGSLNGGSIFKKHFSKLLGLDDENELSFFSVFDDNFKHFWAHFTDKLNSDTLDLKIKGDIISGAEEIFFDLMKIYNCLYPIVEKDMGNHITSLNPEAGNYPIPTDPFEINSAISAGLKCWEEFPFYEKRYGERGRRFTVSDSAWLVTLSELSIDLAVSQVMWLAKYLAKIGMPTITMEFQLKYLYQGLSEAIPEKEPRYNTLLIASNALKENRSKFLKPQYFEESNSVFNSFLEKNGCSNEKLNNTGLLICSSITDLRNGYDDSVQAFKCWITDPLIFSNEWIKAVEETYSFLNQK